MIIFPCPKCATTLKVEDEHAGGVVACGACQRKVLAPTAINVELVGDPLA